MSLQNKIYYLKYPYKFSNNIYCALKPTSSLLRHLRCSQHGRKNISVNVCFNHIIVILLLFIIFQLLIYVPSFSKDLYTRSLVKFREKWNRLGVKLHSGVKWNRFGPKLNRPLWFPYKTFRIHTCFIFTRKRIHIGPFTKPILSFFFCKAICILKNARIILTHTLLIKFISKDNTTFLEKQKDISFFMTKH